MNTNVDDKVLDRVRKLLNLSRDGGASEAEAALAAEHAERLMREHGISVALAEMRGEQGEARVREDDLDLAAHEKWMPQLMVTLAETCFCSVRLMTKSGGRTHGAGFEIIGRASAVATCRVTYEYLVQTVNRLARERSWDKEVRYFKRGVAERVAERLEAKHREEMEKQLREAERQREYYAAHPTSNALVVVLEDYAQKEQDLNCDMRNGWEPGTTARKREDRAKADEQASRQRAERIAKYVAELGVSREVADYMASGFSQQRAEELVNPPPETDKQRERRLERERRARQRLHRSWEKEDRKRDSASWQAGRRAGDDVSLDRQVEEQTTKHRRIGHE